MSSETMTAEVALSTYPVQLKAIEKDSIDQILRLEQGQRADVELGHLLKPK